MLQAVGQDVAYAQGARQAPGQQELAIALALAALGPQDSGAPPDAVWLALQQLVDAALPRFDPECILEIVIAWGCGWQRRIQSPADQWEGRWSRAVLALRSIVEGSVRQAIEQIAQFMADSEGISQQFRALLMRRPDGSHTPAYGQRRSYANLIALELMHDRCSCSYHRRGCRELPDGQHSCGRDCCVAGHRLSTWQPADRMLRVFVAEAVRGSAARSLQTGAFATSALYPRLREDSGLRVALVEFKICHVGNAPFIAIARQQGKQPALKGLAHPPFEGNRCPTCHTAADRQHTYFYARKNWLAIPYEEGGTYSMIERWRCTLCGNLYPLEETQCPLCRSGSQPQRPTTVWMYHPWSQRLPTETATAGDESEV
jgi:hypothetical protein